MSYSQKSSRLNPLIQSAGVRAPTETDPPPFQPPAQLVWLVLLGRTLVFLMFQGLLALFLWVGSGPGDLWREAAAWWPLTVTAGNGVCLVALVWLYRREGKRYWGLFAIRRETLGTDLLIMLAALFLIGPLGYFPNVWLGEWLFGDPDTALAYFLQPLPLWAAVSAVLVFPVLHGLVELPLYFAYVMPRLDRRRFPNLTPVIWPGLVLSLQHIAMPLLFSWQFIAWRGLMFLPFAFAVGIVLHWRPRLLPYFVVIHILIDLSLPLMLLGLAY